MKNGRFVTLITCIDGRSVIPALNWAREKFGADYVDIITEPGPDKILAEKKDKKTVSSIKKKATLSVEKHSSAAIVVAGHHDCAGNPAGKKEHLRHIKEAVETVRSWNLNAETAGIWIGADFTAEAVESTTPKYARKKE